MGQIIKNECKIGRLFGLENLHVPSVSNLCAIFSPSTFYLWHHRLAHISLEKLCLLMSTGILGQVNNEFFD